MTGFGVALAKDVMVPMRDGIRLATDVYRPARDGELVEGRYPTILCRTPYDKTDKRYSEIADFFVPHGYTVCLQDCRDRYRSEGTREYFHAATPHEGEDGYDTVEWIAEQRWSNGRVGTVGSSFAAITQVRMALERPPHLTAIWPDVVPTNSFQHQSREGGAMQLHMFWALFIHAQDAQDIADDPEKQADVWADLTRLRELFWETPYREGQTSLRHVPTLEKCLLDYYTRGTYDELWSRKEYDYTAYWDEHADIPGTYSTGWYDAFPHSDTEYFAAMAAKNTTPQRLVVGPWSHVGMRGDATYTLDVDFGPDSAWGVQRYFAEQLAFFDRWLKDGDAPVGRGAGPDLRDGRRLGPEDRARQARPRRPLARGARVAARAGAARPSTTCARTARCRSTRPAGEEEPRRYTYDPAHPVPTIGGLYCSVGELPAEGAGMEPAWSRFLSPVLRLRNILTPGPADQQETPEFFAAREPYPRLSERADVLVYETEPLEEPVEVTGRARVTLRVSSSAVDTDFTAKLVDVHPPNEDYPDGYDMLINDSIIRCRYREGFEREVFMEPGEVVEVTIELPPTSNLFDRGHRIRIDVSSSNFPRLDLNPNTGEPIGRHTHQVVAEQAVARRSTRRRCPSFRVIDWVAIPAGPFPMGIDPAAAYPPDEDETPRRVVSVEGFRIGRTPVTGDDGVPLTYVSRDDAEAFCAANGVRLPTEIEWEAAARGGDDRLWPWGDELPDTTRATFGQGIGGPSPAGSASGRGRAVRRARPGGQRLRVDGRRRGARRLVPERPGRAALLGAAARCTPRRAIRTSASASSPSSRAGASTGSRCRPATT